MKRPKIDIGNIESEYSNYYDAQEYPLLYVPDLEKYCDWLEGQHIEDMGEIQQYEEALNQAVHVSEVEEFKQQIKELEDMVKDHEITISDYVIFNNKQNSKSRSWKNY